MNYSTLKFSVVFSFLTKLSMNLTKQVYVRSSNGQLNCSESSAKRVTCQQFTLITLRSKSKHSGAGY